MPECDYCGAEHDSETAHLKHLKSEHRDELGPIDRRRVGDVQVDDGGIPAGPIALGVVLLASIGIVAYVVFIAGSGSAGAATYDPQNHEHGTMEVVIDGEELDFMDDEFVEQDRIFHFHGYEQDEYGANVWHIHGFGVTVAYALESLGIEINDDATVVSYDGQTYDASEAGTEIQLEVNGESVAPDYELSGVGPEGAAADGQGDDLRLVVETDG